MVTAEDFRKSFGKSDQRFIDLLLNTIHELSKQNMQPVDIDLSAEQEGEM